MPFVVDASVAASWLLPDESDLRADKAFSLLAMDHARAPSLWWFEVRNLLVTNERRGRIDSLKSTRALRLLAGLPIRLDDHAGQARLLELARRHRLTMYDAAYLELAEREGIPLATLDRQLAEGAASEGVPLIA